MNIQKNIPFSKLTTMKLGGIANYVADVTSRDELHQLYTNARKLDQPVYILGGGSNLIVHDEGFPGVVARILIKGIEFSTDNQGFTTVRAAGGEKWDDLVAATVERNLMGIESLSGVPGTVGAAPVQNIGAYGQELADTLVSLEAYDTQADKFVELSWDDCNFSYRNSIFRSTAAGRYVIVSITLKLYTTQPAPPFYDSLQRYLDSKGITEYTVATIRQAVLDIRSSKLPDPSVLPNAGSFFKNAIVESWKATALKENYPDMPTYPVDGDMVKIPAGWLIENADLKGKEFHGIKVHEDNAVVLINQSAQSYSDLAAAREEIIDEVRDKFQIILEQEPLELSSLQSSQRKA